MAGVRALLKNMGAVLARRERILAAVEQLSGLVGSALIDKVRLVFEAASRLVPVGQPVRRATAPQTQAA
jgi:hypothetical protein